MRNPKDVFVGLIYIAFGLAAILLARDYDMGSATRMGPAYFPTAVGALLALIGAISLFRGLIVPGAPLYDFAWRPLAIIAGASVLFAFVLRPAGLVPAVLLLVVIGAMASQRFRLVPTLLLAAGLAAFSALVFVKGLGVPAPLFGTWFN